MWMASCTGSVRGGFGEIWKKSVSWVEFLALKKTVDFRLLTEALWRVHTWCRGRWKKSIERLCLSPYIEKPFNSKVIKGFVPELRSRKCFSYFGIPMFYVYMLWTFYVRFNIHIWVWYTSLPIGKTQLSTSVLIRL